MTTEITSTQVKDVGPNEVFTPTLLPLADQFTLNLVHPDVLFEQQAKAFSLPNEITNILASNRNNIRMLWMKKKKAELASAGDLATPNWIPTSARLNIRLNIPEIIPIEKRKQLNDAHALALKTFQESFRNLALQTTLEEIKCYDPKILQIFQSILVACATNLLEIHKLITDHRINHSTLGPDHSKEIVAQAVLELFRAPMHTSQGWLKVFGPDSNCSTAESLLKTFLADKSLIPGTSANTPFANNLTETESQSVVSLAKYMDSFIPTFTTGYILNVDLWLQQSHYRAQKEADAKASALKNATAAVTEITDKEIDDKTSSQLFADFIRSTVTEELNRNKRKQASATTEPPKKKSKKNNNKKEGTVTTGPANNTPASNANRSKAKNSTGGQPAKPSDPTSSKAKQAKNGNRADTRNTKKKKKQITKKAKPSAASIPPTDTTEVTPQNTNNKKKQANKSRTQHQKRNQPTKNRKQT